MKNEFKVGNWRENGPIENKNAYLSEGKIVLDLTPDFGKAVRLSKSDWEHLKTHVDNLFIHAIPKE